MGVFSSLCVFTVDIVNAGGMYWSPKTHVVDVRNMSWGQHGMAPNSGCSQQRTLVPKLYIGWLVDWVVENFFEIGQGKELQIESF